MFLPFAPRQDLASTTLAAPLTYQLPGAVRLNWSSSKPLRLLGSVRTPQNLAIISLIPLAIIVVTNMNLGIGASKTPNPAVDPTPFGRWTLRDEAAQRRFPRCQTT